MCTPDTLAGLSIISLSWLWIIPGFLRVRANADDLLLQQRNSVIHRESSPFNPRLKFGQPCAGRSSIMSAKVILLSYRYFIQNVITIVEISCRIILHDFILLKESIQYSDYTQLFYGAFEPRFSLALKPKFERCMTHPYCIVRCSSIILIKIN